MRALVKAMVCAFVVWSVIVGGAWASGPTGSPLPDFPRFRGVMLVHNGSPASAERERSILAALKAAGGGSTPNCAETAVNLGADLCYWGGPVVHAHAVHLIFWGGSGGRSAFPSGYIAAVERYFEDVARASGARSNVYSVVTQYEGSNGPGVYEVSFDPATSGPGHDVAIDSEPFVNECTDAATPSTCVTDEEIQAQVTAVSGSNGWSSSLSNVFFVFTPPAVGSCFTKGSSETGDACAFVEGGYCAYHKDFGPSGSQTLYANIPDNGGVKGCDAGEHPNGAGEADATLDVTSHEHIETITDPLGSQIGEKNGWTDVIGQEIGDKCLPPETFDTYGELFEGRAGELSNQLISGDRFFLQREWSNSAFNGQGGCVGRMLHAAFAAPGEAKATVAAAFDGSASGEVGDPADYWIWSFGDGVQVGSPEPIVAHTYARAGFYHVTLTAFDEAGNSNTATAIVTVGEAPPATPVTPLPAPVVIKEVIKEAIVPGRLTSAQVAERLGLPANGKKLTGEGSLSLGHAGCPPACGVTLRLYAKVTTTSHKRRTTKQVLVGTAQVMVAAKALKTLSLSLNGKGKQLLRKLHTLPCKLLVMVEGQEGGNWQIVRLLTLKR
ncbi:MAG TPA: PKD domain-containing protein [Solirubrobacteraceae bacterium]|jgi:hypothetical protein|nr:PKD domain-containing protein [Solirubrobacteraceae bacterium]